MKPLRIAILSVTSLFLSGCVMTHAEEGLNALQGKPISTAVSVIGYPDGQQKFQNDTVYIWSRSHQVSYNVPHTATTTGYVGNTPVYGTTTYNSVETAEYFCTIKLIVGPNNLIRNWQLDGNPGGTLAYSGNLKRYADSQKPKQ